MKLEGALKSFFNARGKPHEIALACFEDDVAALYVGLRLSQIERLIKGAQGVHFDPVVPREIDAAQHGDDDTHREPCDRARLSSNASHFGS
jgi:hypothetical protein